LIPSFLVANIHGRQCDDFKEYPQCSIALTTQAPERDDIQNIGGFSDAVFNVVASYLSDDATRFVAEVESVEL
jgi:uncharacterized Rossmann fold enzyme